MTHGLRQELIFTVGASSTDLRGDTAGNLDGDIAEHRHREAMATWVALA